ncbi:MAG: tRNA (adenosine(37)-N6)-threonylcarbamoyltransferase complex transferase subunit TsaD [Bacteroidales bacterium]|nr:tRNA (adenosine(37)-N6)-threonylcarbamoyltransferase complex transferase subunit TsaD [Bacteroidales bacterium]
MSTILAIESSCDDTSAAVLRDDVLLSNVIASQKVHEQYGGVVPELASRAHEQNIIPVVDGAIREAGIRKEEIDAVAFTRGPGLMGSLMVGVSFAKSFAQALGKPIIEVNHLQAHVLSHFIRQEVQECRSTGEQTNALPDKKQEHSSAFLHSHTPTLPSFPFICLLVSGGHTQILLLHSHFDMEILGQTIDDAAGEAIDKAAKIMDLGYPGGPIIDRLAKEGDPEAFHFATPQIAGYDYSFSGIKTSFLYFLRDRLKEDPDFIEKNKADLCASIQKTIVDFLLKKVEKAALKHGVRQVAIAGGVSANSRLRSELQRICDKHRWQAFIPPFKFCTDNAAMVGIAGYFKYLKGEFADISLPPYTR